MATAVGALDDAIREYLVYRGFTNTLKQFETEKRDDKDKNFRVSKLACVAVLDEPLHAWHPRMPMYIFVYYGYTLSLCTGE